MPWRPGLPLPILHTSVIILNDDVCHVSVLRVSTMSCLCVYNIYASEIKRLYMVHACMYVCVCIHRCMHMLI